MKHTEIFVKASPLFHLFPTLAEACAELPSQAAPPLGVQAEKVQRKRKLIKSSHLRAGLYGDYIIIW